MATDLCVFSVFHDDVGSMPCVHRTDRGIMCAIVLAAVAGALNAPHYSINCIIGWSLALFRQIECDNRRNMTLIQ